MINPTCKWAKGNHLQLWNSNCVVELEICENIFGWNIVRWNAWRNPKMTCIQCSFHGFNHVCIQFFFITVMIMFRARLCCAAVLGTIICTLTDATVVIFLRIPQLGSAKMCLHVDVVLLQWWWNVPLFITRQASGLAIAKSQHTFKTILSHALDFWHNEH